MRLAVQFAGAFLILVPFALLLAGRMGRQDRTYLWLNLIGSALLTVNAWLERQWGFVPLQVVWGLVAAWGLVKRVPAAAHDPESGSR
jgi:hypothetical protein